MPTEAIKAGAGNRNLSAGMKIDRTILVAKLTEANAKLKNAGIAAWLANDAAPIFGAEDAVLVTLIGQVEGLLASARAATPEPAFCSGFGQFHTDEPDKAKRRPYSTITFAQIQAMVDNPPSVDKSKGRWFIPSTLLSRNFAKQETEGGFGIIAADLDKNPKPLAEVAASVRGIVGNANFEIYASRSATEGKQKGRILIELPYLVDHAEMVRFQKALADKLAEQGIEIDTALMRPAQLVYLPNRGDFYTHFSERGGEPFDARAAWASEIAALAEQDAAAEAAAKEAAEARAKARAERLAATGGDASTLGPIERYNLTTDVSTLLLKHGYEEDPFRPGNWRHPASESGNYSLQVTDAGGVYGLSSEDPLGGPKNGGHALSPFDVLTTLECGGDDAKARETVGCRVPTSATEDFAEELADDETQLDPSAIRMPAPFNGAHASIVSAILRSSHVPQSDLAFLCALVGMAACVPPPYHFKDGTRCNLYGAGLAESTEGKEAAPNAVEAMCRKLGVTVLSKPASGEALEDAIDNLPMLCNIREAGHVFSVLAGSNPAPQHISLVAALLDAFSMGSRTFTPRPKANQPLKDPVPNPTISLLMMSTPGKMAKALTEDNISDGLLGRILLTMGNTDGKLNLDCDALVLPEEVDAFDYSSGEGEHSGGLIVWSADADILQRKLVTDWFEQKRELQRVDDVLTAALIGRRGEKFKRICGVLAVWANPKAPTITVPMVEWAARVVEISDATMMAFVGGGLGSDDQSVTDAERVLRSMRKIKAGVVRGRVASQSHVIENGGIPRSLVQDNSRLGPDRFGKALKHLTEIGRVVEDETAYVVGEKERRAGTLAFVGRR